MIAVTETQQLPVLVVGGGLAGLTTAIALGRYNIPTILIERRPKTLEHPRANGFTPRTTEIFRSLGLSKELVPEVEEGYELRRIRVKSLVGEWFEELAWNPNKDLPGSDKNDDDLLDPPDSPFRGISVPQDTLEPILRQHAKALGVDIRMETELVGLHQNAKGVSVQVRVSSGVEQVLQAAYLVACDGHRSRVRETLGITRRGRGHINSVKSVLFRASGLESYLDKGFAQFIITQPDLKAMMLAYSDRRLVLHLTNDQEFDDELLLSLTHKAVGTKDVELEILDASRWDMSALIASEFHTGRIFLVGDAAHSLPPNRGGYGANTGIADAHNLAWKMAHVMKGISKPELLDTYSAERMPIAWLRHDQIFARTDFKALNKDAEVDQVVEPLEDSAVEFGELYRSSAVLHGDVEMKLPMAQSPKDWAGQPGTRAPHVLLRSGDVSFSSLELFQGIWTLLSEEKGLGESFRSIMEDTRCDGVFVAVEARDSDDFCVAYGIAPGGASLVRPDGYIAWRSSSSVTSDVLREVMSSLIRM